MIGFPSDIITGGNDGTPQSLAGFVRAVWDYARNQNYITARGDHRLDVIPYAPPSVGRELGYTPRTPLWWSMQRAEYCVPSIAPSYSIVGMNTVGLKGPHGPKYDPRDCFFYVRPPYLPQPTQFTPVPQYYLEAMNASFT